MTLCRNWDSSNGQCQWTPDGHSLPPRVCNRKGVLLIKDTKQILTRVPKWQAVWILGVDLAQRGSKRLFEEGGGGGLGWLHAGSQAFRVCVGALKCHLERRASGRVVEGAGAMKGVAPLALPDTALLILHGLPSISLHMQDIASAWFIQKVDLSLLLFMLWFNTCAGFCRASALQRGVSGSL